MALTKITKTGITDDAVETAKIKDSAVTAAKIAAIPNDSVDATKIADDAISEEHLDNTVFTANAELSATAADDDVLLIYDTSAGTIKKIQASNVGVLAATLTSISPTNVNTGDGTGNATFTITGKNFTVGTLAFLTNTSGTEIAFDSLTRNSSTQLTGVIAKSSIPGSGEPYDISVIAGNGTQATLRDQVNINQQPVFVTSSGSLGTGTGDTAESFSVNATDPESAAAVTFELQSGTLPPGLSLSNSTADGGTAIISGTATDPDANTTYNFVLRAVDAASNVSSRAFAITINKAITFQTFTSSGTFAVPSGVTSLNEVLVVGGGGGGGGGWNGCNSGGGGGAGGLIFFPGYPVAPGGTITVTIGCGGPNVNPGGPSGPTESPGISGQNSVFGAPGDPGFSPTSSVLTAQGGGAGGGGTATAGLSGGSGGGGSAGTETPKCGGSGQQSTQPGDSGSYGFGNNGGNGGGGPGRAAAGGGAGSVGGQGGNACVGVGGDGKAYTIADGTTSVYYAGGGGGGAGNPSSSHSVTGGPGGQGGGGTGQNGPNITAQTTAGGSGGANKGGGGGGGSNPGRVGFPGGKGVVIVKY